MTRHEHLLTHVGRIEQITILESGKEPPQSATALLGNMKILVPMAGLIDVEAECARLSRKRQKSLTDRMKSENKLGNPKFVNNAPEAVVDKERRRIDDLRIEIEQLDTQLEKLESLAGENT